MSKRDVPGDVTVYVSSKRTNASPKLHLSTDCSALEQVPPENIKTMPRKARPHAALCARCTGEHRENQSNHAGVNHLSSKLKQMDKDELPP